MIQRFRYFYDDDGNILRREKIEQGLFLTDNGNWIEADGIYNPTFWKINTDTQTFEKVEHDLPNHPIFRQPATKTWDHNRRINYGTAEQQMNWLYDDINDGKFGEDAKTGKWFTHVKAVKDKYPKA